MQSSSICPSCHLVTMTITRTKRFRDSYFAKRYLRCKNCQYKDFEIVSATDPMNQSTLIKHRMTPKNGKAVSPRGGGWNRKTVAEHLADGTYRADRHGALASSVLAYPKPPRKVRAGIKSQRRWIRSEADERAFANGCRFNERLALHVVEFFPKYLRHSKGRWAGQPFELLPWQRDDLLMPLFGWVRPDGLRRFRRAFTEIPKKNGKSTLASGLGLYMLCADGEAGAEVYSAAADKDQASIVHGEAIRMAEASDSLAACLKINRSTRNILYHANNSWYRALSSEAATKEGLNIHCCIIDEFHIWHGRDLYDTLRYGYRSRLQPLEFIITTAGDDDQSICYEELERARAHQRGELLDDSYFSLIYEADPQCDWKDEAEWAKANPSMGSTFNIESLREDANKAAAGRIAEQAVFKRYSLNIWQKSANPWLSMDDWDRNAEEYDLASFAGRDCYAGLDLSRTRDMSALVLIFVDDSGQQCIYRQLPYFWIPRVALETYKQKLNLAQWTHNKYLDVLDDSYDLIERQICKVAETCNLLGIGYDPMYARDFMERINQEHGIPIIEIPQTIMSFAGPTAEYERLLIHDCLKHPNHPILNWQASHVQVKTDANNNKRPVKPPLEDHRKIDGIVAGIMGLRLAMLNAPIPSAYEDQGMMYAEDLMMEAEAVVE